MGVRNGPPAVDRMLSVKPPMRCIGLSSATFPHLAAVCEWLKCPFKNIFVTVYYSLLVNVKKNTFLKLSISRLLFRVKQRTVGRDGRVDFEFLDPLTLRRYRSYVQIKPLLDENVFDQVCDLCKRGGRIWQEALTVHKSC